MKFKNLGVGRLIGKRTLMVLQILYLYCCRENTMNRILKFPSTKILLTTLIDLLKP